MFYPFRCMADLRIEGSYWKTFYQQLQSHLKQEKTIFWHKGFDILQNINDRMTLERELKQAKDPIFLTTKNKKPDAKYHQKMLQKRK